MILVRKADLQAEPHLRKWMEEGAARTEYDPKVLDYPLTEVLAAHTNGTTYTATPIQPVTMIEGIGVNPESSNQEITAALIETIKAIVFTSQRGGIREVYFLTEDENTADAAAQIGFEELPPCKVMRMRVK